MKKLTLLFLSCASFVAVRAQTVPTLVADIQPGFVPSGPGSLTVLGSEIYFKADEYFPSGSSQLYRYKPSTGLATITPGYIPALVQKDDYPFGVVNGKLYFLAHNVPTVTGSQSTYCVTEGGPMQIVDSGIAGFSDYATNWVTIGTKLYGFGYVSGTFGMVSIGPGNHHTLEGDLSAVGLTSDLRDLTVLNGKIYVISNTSPSGQREIYAYDLTTNTAAILPTFISPIGNPEFFNLIAGTDNKLYFIAQTVSDGGELYSITAAGVMTKLTSFSSSLDGVHPGNQGLVQFNNAIYFSGTNGTSGFELMKYDMGTGVVSLVKDINPSAGSSDPDYFKVHNGKLYFSAENPTSGREIWVTDGTTAGTTMLVDMYPGASSSNPKRFTSLGNKIYFTGDNGTSGEEVYSFTAAGPSGIVSISGGANQMTVYPNPAHSTATVNVDLNEAMSLSIVLMDVTGKQVYKVPTQQYQKGLSTVTVSLNNLAAGNYQCCVVAENGKIIATGKLVCE